MVTVFKNKLEKNWSWVHRTLELFINTIELVVFEIRKNIHFLRKEMLQNSRNYYKHFLFLYISYYYLKNYYCQYNINVA